MTRAGPPRRTGLALGVALTTALACMWWAGPALGAGHAGGLDRSFGRAGVVTTRMDALVANRAFVHGGVLQGDGKVIAVGQRGAASGHDLALVRYQPDGSLDPSFGTGGIVATDLGGAGQGNAAAVQPDGRIVVVGQSNSGATTTTVLVRYRPDGTLDPSFGIGGIVSIDLGANAVGTAVALQGDGKVLVAGERSSGDGVIAVGRYNADGSPDPSFGVGGIATADVGPFGSASVFANALIVQSDGKVVAAGVVQGAFAVARFQPDGSLDATFGSGGIVTTPVSSGLFSLHAGVAAALQPDGRLVLAGTLLIPSNGATELALARYEADGSLDPTFGGAGIDIAQPFGSPREGRLAMALQSSGKIILGGTGRFLLTRFNPDGSVDTEFGNAYIYGIGPLATVPVPGNSANVAFLAVDDTDAITAVGESIVCHRQFTPDFQCPLISSQVAIARFTPDGSADASFGGAGFVTTTIGIDALRGFASPKSALVQPGGRIVVVGSVRARNATEQRYDFALARYRRDGSLDPSFGDGGRVVTDLAGDAASFFGYATAALQQPDGKIVVAGSEQSSHGSFDGVALARYLRDGSLDPSFGDRGVVATRSKLRATVSAAALQRDGKVVVAGSDGPGLTLARYNPDGSLDPSFGDGGEVKLDVPGLHGPLTGVVVERGGRIVVAARDAVVGIGPDGAVDGSFGGDGVAASRVSKGGHVTGLVRVRRRLLAFGVVHDRVALFRYRLDGSPDRGFGTRGRVVSRAGPFARVVQSAAAQRNGKVLVAGTFYPRRPVPTAPSFGLLRFNRNGSLDRSFGRRGLARPGAHGVATAVAASGRGRPVVAGRTSGGELRLARFRG